jgi:hypothetical protein
MTLLEQIVKEHLQAQQMTLKAAARGLKIRPETIRNAYCGRYPMSGKTRARLARWLGLDEDAIRHAATLQMPEAEASPVAAQSPAPVAHDAEQPPALLPAMVETGSGIKVRETINVRGSCEKCPWLALCGADVRADCFAWCEEVIGEEILSRR